MQRCRTCPQPACMVRSLCCVHLVNAHPCYVCLYVCPSLPAAVFGRFRAILHEGQIDRKVQYVIETLFAVRKGGFQDHPAVLPELDLVESDDQIPHEISLDDAIDRQENLGAV